MNIVLMRRSLLVVGLAASLGCAAAACAGGGEQDLNPQPLPPSSSGDVPVGGGKSTGDTDPNTPTGENTGATSSGSSTGGSGTSGGNAGTSSSGGSGSTPSNGDAGADAGGDQ